MDQERALGSVLFVMNAIKVHEAVGAAGAAGTIEASGVGLFGQRKEPRSCRARCLAR